MSSKHRHSSTYKHYSRDEWETPDSIFEPLNTHYKFVCDLAASSDNAKCVQYITKEKDALTIDWPAYGWSWCNPPFGHVAEFTEKAAQQQKGKRGKSVLLIPSNRCEQEWFVDAAGATLIVMIRKRVNYVPPEGIDASSAGFGSMLLVYGGSSSVQLDALAAVGTILKPL